MIRRLLRSQAGVAVAEFALVLPVLMTFFYGCIEVTRYILAVQKTEKLAFTVANVVAQEKTVTNADLTSLLSATDHIMDPFAFEANGTVLISSLYRAQGASGATVNWQYTGGGTLAAISHLGAVGATPAMPGGFTFDNKENVIAAEVFYKFSPLITTRFFSTTTVYRVAFYKPRLGALTASPS
ncbi:MAG: TadE/TadG family type IV pilus assembly protein [Alphaproteobacteria bacterium]